MNFAIEYFNCLVSDGPRRIAELRGVARRPLVVAMDAQADPGGEPSGGFVLIDMEMSEPFAVMFSLIRSLIFPLWRRITEALFRSLSNSKS